MAQQTAVEWLAENIHLIHSLIWNDIIEQAKAMEKEQIIDAFDTGTIDDNMIGNEYYNESFGK